ncbi:MAG: R3H domain-containing nucleic acid-binding protein, partial [Candidatus Promineifilaceae bacterium]
ELKVAAPALTGRRNESAPGGRNPRRSRLDRGNGGDNNYTNNGSPYNGHQSKPMAERKAANGESGRSTKTLNIYAYGVARNRLTQAARHLNVPINLVDGLGDADVLVTLKSYFRRQRKLIIDAQNRRTPVFVLRANTVSQMENFLAEAMNLEVAPPDPFEDAIAETEKAIQMVQSGQQSVDLTPVGSAIRRYQHQMARQANLVSHSYGKGPNRHVRIFSTPRNAP